MESKLQHRPQITVTSNHSPDTPPSDTPPSSVTTAQESTKLSIEAVDPSPRYDTPSNIPVRGKECAGRDNKAARSLSPPPADAKNYRTGVSET